MIRTIAAAVAISVLPVAAVQAQDTILSESAQGLAYNFGPDYFHASTLAEGVLTGLGRLERSIGNRRYNEALARVFEEEARRRFLDNRVKYVETYFEVKRINESYRAAKQRPAPSLEDMMRYNQLRGPDRLSAEELDPALGRIAWPPMLERPQFDTYRDMLEVLFAQRTPSDSGVGTDNYRAIRELTEAWMDELAERMRQGEMSPEEYVGAKRFVRSLRYESSFRLEGGDTSATPTRGGSEVAASRP